MSLEKHSVHDTFMPIAIALYNIKHYSSCSVKATTTLTVVSVSCLAQWNQSDHPKTKPASLADKLKQAINVIEGT